MIGAPSIPRALLGARGAARPQQGLAPHASVAPQHSSGAAEQQQVHVMPLQQRTVPGPLPGTRRVQHAQASEFGSSISTLLLGAALLSERLNGVGVVQAIELHEQRFHPLLIVAVAALAAASVWPPRTRPPGAPQVTLEQRVRVVGGRAAHAGLAAVLLGEMLTGKGALALLDFETGVEAVSDVEGALVFMALLVLTGNSNRGASSSSSSFD